MSAFPAFALRTNPSGLLVLVCALVLGPAAVRAAPGDAAPAPPVYTTRMPPPLTLDYTMRKGGWTGSGELHWRPDGTRYEARLEGRVAGFKVLNWTSDGGFDQAGLAPLRFSDQRRGKSLLAANFQRPGGRITYSASSNEFPLVPGAQDRLSWMLQIAAIALAEPRRVAPGQRISFFVTGARGDGDVWTFQSQAIDNVTVAGVTARAVRLLREPRKPKDTRVEVWLDPQQHYLPIRARLSSDGETLELLLRALHPPM